MCAHFVGPFRATEVEARLDCKLDAQFGVADPRIAPLVDSYPTKGVKENGAKEA